MQTADGILFTRDGRVLVTDLFGNSVQTFNLQGKYQGPFVANINPPAIPPSSPFQSNAPSGITYDRNGNFVVALGGYSQSQSTGAIVRYNSAIGVLLDNNAPFISGIPTATNLVYVSAQTNWNFNADSSYGDATKWDPQTIPNGSGISAVFGNGTSISVGAGLHTVTIDGAYTVGSLLFTNTNGARFSLAGDGKSGHGITLNNGGIGAAINVTGGGAMISAPLTLADSGGHNLYVAPNTSLTVSSAIGETGGSQRLNKSGAGTLILTGENTFTGGTTVSNGSLVLYAPDGHGALAAGTTVLVSNSATLEMLGAQSALGSATVNPIRVVNNSSAPAGVLVMGAIQQAGGIDGVGSTQVQTGADLTVGHIIQNALIIGGAAGTPSTVVISPSSPPVLGAVQPGDAAATAGFSGLILAGSRLPSGPFAADDVAAINADSSAFSTTAGPAATLAGDFNLGSASAVVPEPATIFLTLFAACGLLGDVVSRRRIGAIRRRRRRFVGLAGGRHAVWQGDFDELAVTRHQRYGTGSQQICAALGLR